MRSAEAPILPGREGHNVSTKINGLSFFDASPGGGFFRGGITEIFGGASSGKTTLAYLIVSSFVQRGELAAWIDLPNCFDPGCARNAGVDLDRVLWVAPRDPLMAIRAVDLLLKVGGFRVVVLDLGSSVAAKSRVSTAAWLKVSRLAIARHALVVILAVTCVYGAFTKLSLEASFSQAVFTAQNSPCPSFDGVSSSLLVRKFKGQPAIDRLQFFASPTG